MQPMTMLSTQKGSPNGAFTFEYVEGETYDENTSPPLSEELGKTFTELGWAKEADAEANEDAGSNGEAPELKGSKALADPLEIADGVSVPASEIIAKAFAESGLTASKWNRQSDEARNTALQAVVEALKTTPPAPPPAA